MSFIAFADKKVIKLLSSTVTLLETDFIIIIFVTTKILILRIKKLKILIFSPEKTMLDTYIFLISTSSN